MRERIVAFLDRVGIPTAVADLPDPEACFLPGVRLQEGRVLHDPARLRWPGDLLHEAGHVALTPDGLRMLLTGAVSLPDTDPVALEAGVWAWSYAAALHLDVDPAAVFHEGGYRGRGPALLAQFRLGVPLGVHVLEEAGMTSRLPGEDGVAYPAMRRWLA